MRTEIKLTDGIWSYGSACELKILQKLADTAFYEMQLYKPPGVGTLQRILEERSLIELECGAGRTSKKQTFRVEY